MSDGLEQVCIQGLGSLSDVTLRPGRLTVLIGSNGSGKSNILKALKLAPLLRTQSLRRFVTESGGASSLLHYGPKRTPELSLELDFVQGEQANRYRARLAYTSNDGLFFARESASFRPAPGAEWTESDLGTGHTESQLDDASPRDATARTARDWLSQLTFFHFHDTSSNAQLRTPARTEDDRYLRSDGSNLAAYLHRLGESQEEADQKAWRRIRRLVRRIAPSVKDLSPALVNGGSRVRLDWIDDQDERFGVHQLSDGSLRAIALITALGQPATRMPRFISIDEPELGLHPAAITLIAELARSVSRHTQILFATQSTAFLDHFLPEEVVVVERRAGATVLQRLEAETLAGWLEDYSLSEVFDKGVIGGQP